MVPFKYVDFYDVPRVIMFRYRGKLFLLGSYFDDEMDDYDRNYSIQTLPFWVEDKITESASWKVLEEVTDAQLLGEIAVQDVRFDETRRRTLDPTFLDRYMEPGEAE